MRNTKKEEMDRVRCNNCMEVYIEHEYELVLECSKCETEDFLMDLMSRDELVDKITDRWTDNIYSDIVDILQAYTLEFEMEDEAGIVDDVIAKMIKMYK